ncbi:MAG: alkaline phosphatase family protein, partial [Treponemataceae bacterium]|nr:alkaline phosphatase family protein [Treponemataceae bacterium]
MKVKNDYTNCLTNLACSVQKYFEIPYAHTTLSDIDALLAEQQPENVVVFLLDGMGDNILSRNLPSTSFFRSNRLRSLYSVFPATTTACTMSILTGLNPVEHGWLGWDMYVEPLDKTMTLFLGIEKVSKERESDYISKTHDLTRKYLPEQITDAGNYDGVLLAPFIDPKYRDFDVLTADVQAVCSKPAKNGKRYVYAYYPDPDGTMHDKGPDSDE